METVSCGKAARRNTEHTAILLQLRRAGSKFQELPFPPSASSRLLLLPSNPTAAAAAIRLSLPWLSYGLSFPNSRQIPREPAAKRLLLRLGTQHPQVTSGNSAVDLKRADRGHTRGLGNSPDVSHNKRHLHPASESSGCSRFTGQTLRRVPKEQLDFFFPPSSAISVFDEQFPYSFTLTPIYYRKEIKYIQNNLTA